MKPTGSAGSGSTVNSNTSTPGINNKYGTTYHAIRQLLKEIHITHQDFYDDANDATTMVLSLTRQDLARLDELRRLLCASWMEHCDCHGSTTGSDATTNTTNNTSSTIEKWYAFLRNSRSTLVNQLCQRLQSPPHSSSLSSLSLSSYRLLVCRTFWGVVAGTPIPTNQNNNDDKNNVPPPMMMIIDVQLLQRFVRAVVGNNRNSENAVSDDLLHGHSDTTWTLRPNDTDSKALHQFLCHECIQPHRDVQYYLMSSIHAVASELYAPDSHNNNDNAKTPTTMTAAGIERLLELLMMMPPVPLNVSPQEFAQSSKSFIPMTTRPQNTSTLKTSNRPKRNDNEEEDDDDDKSQDDDEEEEEDDDSEESDDDDHQTSKNVPSFLSKKRYIKMMTKAWLSLLRLRPLSEYIMKQSLLHLPKYVLPMTSSPLRFADFFHFAYGHDEDTTTSGGATTNTGTTTVLPILALEGLFYLMIEHGLEYKNYYKQLYRLLRSSSIYYIKHRMTFLKLLYNSIMKNDALPAHIIAAFAKRLLRQALYASPSTIMFLLTFVSNILRKHPEISCLIHRNGTGSVLGEMDDPYDAVADDPELCHALQSSLWELNALQHHYYSGVVTLAKSIGTENYKQTLPYDCTGEFLTLTYTTIFEQERARNKKQSSNKRRQMNDNDATFDAAHSKRPATTPLAFCAPTTLFTRNDIFSTILSLPNVED